MLGFDVKVFNCTHGFSLAGVLKGTGELPKVSDMA
jgi:hypothetical protein